MRITFILLILLGLSTPALAQDAIEDPVFVFQRVNVLVAHHDNNFSLRVWRDGRAEMRFPPYAAQAGHYRWQIDPHSQAELEAQFSRLDELDLGGLAARMARQRGETLVEISDADWLRLEYRQSGRDAVKVMLESPDAWHRALPEITELASLAELQTEIFDWMQRNAR